MKKTDWDELDDVDDLLGASLLLSRNSNLSTPVIQSAPNLKSKSRSADISLCNSQTNEIELVDDEAIDSGSKKTRRRSAIIDDSDAQVEVKIVGYESRSHRLAEQNQCSSSEGLTEENKSEFNRLLAKGVYLLSMREHSVQEMTNKLTAHSDFVDVVLAVVDELLENDYLSNERFAESYVRSRRNKGFGPVKVKAELKSKGINSRLVMSYLEGDSPEWIDVARSQYEKKYGLNRAENYKEWTKRARFMQSRGFTMEHIQAVLPSAEFY